MWVERFLGGIWCKKPLSHPLVPSFHGFERFWWIQIKGLGTYFVSEHPAEGDADCHVLKIVKVCQVHYERSINRLNERCK